MKPRFRAREAKPCRLKIFFEKFSEVESPQSGSTLDNIRLICANVNKLIMVLKLFFVHPSRWVQRAKTKHRFRFDSGKRAVETKLLKWQSITYLRICVMLTNEIRMRQSAIRVQAHREVKPNSSPSTWDVPRPVQFDSDVRKRAYYRSQQIGAHESNSGRRHRGVTTYSPYYRHSFAYRIPKWTHGKGRDRPPVYCSGFVRNERRCPDATHKSSILCREQPIRRG